jgi:galactokinase
VDTVVRRLRRDFDIRRGADISLASDLPHAAGLSSSSALLVATFIALSRINDMRSNPVFRQVVSSAEELAAYLGAVESGRSFRSRGGDAGVGTLGGCQDHVAIICCEPGHISRYSFTTLKRERLVPWPEDFVLAVGVSGVIAEKTGTARGLYNEAAATVVRLLTEWNRETGRSDEQLAEAIESDATAAARLRDIATRTSGRTSHAADRLEQFLAETYAFIPAATEALERGALTEFGLLVDNSQRLAETSLRNQVPETIQLQRLARTLGAVASSAFGAGFGGSVWAMTPLRGAPRFLAAWERNYREAFPDRDGAVFFLTRPGPHAFQW